MFYTLHCCIFQFCYLCITFLLKWLCTCIWIYKMTHDYFYFLFSSLFLNICFVNSKLSAILFTHLLYDKTSHMCIFPECYRDLLIFLHILFSIFHILCQYAQYYTTFDILRQYALYYTTFHGFCQYVLYYTTFNIFINLPGIIIHCILHKSFIRTLDIFTISSTFTLQVKLIYE